MKGTAHLGDTNSEDGMRAAACMIQGCVACAATGITQRH